ncbi:MAG: hypothetical protein JXA03_13590, partial [Bacteroidales bacterium]|nr:hypothetical protein [Bacteroidales bacterium]
MKKLILLLLLPFFSGIEVDAQAPHAFKYQTVVRDMTGNPMVNQIISFRLSIITGSPDGQVIYIEVHTDTTNLFGMATLDVGKGSAIQGVFSEIDWGASDYFLKTELDESGGSNFSTMGITEILSVPYALNAGSLTLTSPGGKNFDVFVDDDGNLMTSCTPMPTIADAGSDQLNITGSTSVILQGNTPVYGSGLWSILNGAGGSFSDPGDPGTTFYGNVGILYSLRWTITTPCDSSYDETDVSFIYQFLNCGDPFTDIRDGQTYYTVQIGPQCWMKNNLNIGTQIDGSISMTDNGIIEKYCYDNNPANCELYGGLYQWNEVMQYATDPSVQGICPPNGGWHLPSDFEWKILEGTADSQYPVGDPVWSQSGWRGYNAGQNLKSASGWNSANGNDLFGFTALPGGNLVNNIIFADIGDMAHFWTSSSGDTYNANYRYFWIYTNIHRNFSSKENGYSLRCLLDPPLFNQPPAQPSDPQPQNGAQHQPTNTVLSWSCSDPDGTALSFSVWFGLNSNPQLIATHHPDTFYTPASVLMDTTCYWRVVAYDIEGDSTSGPVWSFSTYPVVWQCGLPVLDD